MRLAFAEPLGCASSGLNAKAYAYMKESEGIAV